MCGKFETSETIVTVTVLVVVGGESGHSSGLMRTVL
jgi:hypothetical protein